MAVNSKYLRKAGGQRRMEFIQFAPMWNKSHSARRSNRFGGENPDVHTRVSNAALRESRIVAGQQRESLQTVLVKKSARRLNNRESFRSDDVVVDRGMMEEYGMTSDGWRIQQCVAKDGGEAGNGGTVEDPALP
ncbi:hypothetical protein B0H10DRAFT_1964863 [Mycena sp. CBHHK59/15]|nr:hypothetical protein B0H10DRAFT_1964863 [Mycena sp. CBHHK59/15]